MKSTLTKQEFVKQFEAKMVETYGRSVEQSHITETALEDYEEFDYVIANDDINTLKDKVFKYLEGLK